MNMPCRILQNGRWFAALAVFCLGVAHAARAQTVTDSEPAFLTFQGGAFDVFHDETRGAQFALQYRPAFKFWFMNPMLGLNGSTVGNAYVYAGISFDIFIGNRLVLRPSF